MIAVCGFRLRFAVAFAVAVVVMRRFQVLQSGSGAKPAAQHGAESRHDLKGEPGAKPKGAKTAQQT